MGLDATRDSMVRELLATEGVGAMLAWRAEELVMLLDYQPHWGVSLCLYPQQGEPVLYVPELEPEDRYPSEGVTVRRYGWGMMDCADPWGDLINMVQGDIARLKIEEPVSFIEATGQSTPTTSPGETPPFNWDILPEFKQMTGGGYKPLTLRLLSLYTYKTKREIEAIRQANRVAGTGLKAFYESLEAGRTEAQVASAVESAIQNEMGRDGVIFAKGYAMVMSGPNTAQSGRYNRTTGRVIQEGEPVFIELATCVNGYWSDLTRTGCAGQPNGQFEAMFSTMREAQRRAVEAVAPETACGEIDKIAREWIDEKGYGAHFTHPTGHQVGFRYHDPGPMLAPGVRTPLEPGMIVTVEPGIYNPELGMGCRIEDNVLVKESGCEVLSDVPRSLDGKEA